MSLHETCFYCSKPVFAKSLERDHAPIPQRHDGIETVPACKPCHDLKDRLSLNQWGGELMAQAFAECGPLGRILVAKVYGLVLDIKAEREPAA